jgi:hypothetical protein
MSSGPACARDSFWPLERVLFALAGTMTLLSVALAALVSPWFLLLTAFVGVNQWLYVVVHACPASIAIKRALGLRSAIYDQDPAAAVRRTLGTEVSAKPTRYS